MFDQDLFKLGLELRKRGAALQNALRKRYLHIAGHRRGKPLASKIVPINKKSSATYLPCSPPISGVKTYTLSSPAIVPNVVDLNKGNAAFPTVKVSIGVGLFLIPEPDAGAWGADKAPE